MIRMLLGALGIRAFAHVRAESERVVALEAE